MTHIEIVKKLIGEIQPTGDSAIDDVRRENMNAMGDLVLALVTEMKEVADQRGSQEYSVRILGRLAHQYLTEVTQAA